MNSKQLLSNGYFNKAQLSDMHNMLLMASLANDVYPWSKQYNIPLLDVADGLNSEQVRTQDEGVFALRCCGRMPEQQTGALASWLAGWLAIHGGTAWQAAVNGFVVVVNGTAAAVRLAGRAGSTADSCLMYMHYRQACSTAVPYMG
jgi:hypothetical protein